MKKVWSLAEMKHVLIVLRMVPENASIAGGPEGFKINCKIFLENLGLTPIEPEERVYKLVELWIATDTPVLLVKDGKVLALPADKRSEDTREKILSFLA